MCNNGNDNASPSSSSVVPYSLKTLQAAVAAAVTANDPGQNAAAAYMAIHHSPTASQLTQAAIDHYRMQLYNYVSYADRLRYAHHHHPSQNAGVMAISAPAHHHNPYATPLLPLATTSGGHDVYALTSPYAKFDPCRAYRMHQEEPKPQHSYIGLIGMAILSSPDKKLVLSDIYQHILDNYSYFRNRGPGWRNSIRHNLSLNDCFVKAGRSANGKGHFWAIHPANLEDFKKGDFRRRKAQRRVRKHLGLSIPEDDDSVSPPPAPASATPAPPPSHTVSSMRQEEAGGQGAPDSTTSGIRKRRQFDMDSILAPERRSCCSCDQSAVCCDQVHCQRNLFGAILKTGSFLHAKSATSGGWMEAKSEEKKSRADEKSQQLMMDECSSSSLVTETHTNWALPVDECDSRPNSRSSTGSSGSDEYGPKEEKGLFVIKGLPGYAHPLDVTSAFHKRPLTSSSSSPLPFANESPLTPLSNGKPNSISDSDNRVNQS